MSRIFTINIILKKQAMDKNDSLYLCSICNKMKSINHKAENCIQNKRIKNLDNQTIYCLYCDQYHLKQNQECITLYNMNLGWVTTLNYKNIIEKLTSNQTEYYINKRFINNPKIYNKQYLYFP